jgi:hypothetical protein
MAFMLQFSKDSEFVKYSWERLVNEITGRLIISIGNGTFKDEVSVVLSMAVAWSEYNSKKKSK